MTKYFAVIRLDTVEFEADGDDEAEGMVQELLDQLGTVATDLSWHNSDYTVYIEGGN